MEGMIAACSVQWDLIEYRYTIYEMISLVSQQPTILLKSHQSCTWIHHA